MTTDSVEGKRRAGCQVKRGSNGCGYVRLAGEPVAEAGRRNA